jgi:cysteine synthase A
MPNQFSNPANPEIHRRTTAEEIWADTAGGVDIFVAGVGTGRHHHRGGGSDQGPEARLQVVAVEPADSPVLSGGRPGPHKIQASGPASCPGFLTGKSWTKSSP